MSTLEEHVDVSVPVDTAWNSLHRVENYPRFVDGIRGARTEEGAGHMWTSTRAAVRRDSTPRCPTAAGATCWSGVPRVAPS
ncbi:hypothetical protein MBT84_14215 [Streptomyces sp. MBT84]|uniref:SRPBCC family protein n=1 Tax=Streptomyces sp. MBT84 TaxID=1488414 RepID=UPI001D338F79|nr:SRPBCC family protein [Streptomyces sp. MBT84]MBW8700752.1 hypothetical protein [Streptomyces sp. MBT84]